MRDKKLAVVQQALSVKQAERQELDKVIHNLRTEQNKFMNGAK